MKHLGFEAPRAIGLAAYEMKVLVVDHKTIKDLELCLCELGKEGWHIISISRSLISVRETTAFNIILERSL